MKNLTTREVNAITLILMFIALIGWVLHLIVALPIAIPISANIGQIYWLYLIVTKR